MGYLRRRRKGEKKEEGPFYIFRNSTNYGSFYEDGYWVAACIPLWLLLFAENYFNPVTSHTYGHLFVIIIIFFIIKIFLGADEKIKNVFPSY